MAIADIVVFNAAGPPSLFINETHNANHRVLFRLVNEEQSRMGIGARSRFFTRAMEQVRLSVRGGAGTTQATTQTAPAFSAWPTATMDRIEMRWPSRPEAGVPKRPPRIPSTRSTKSRDSGADASARSLEIARSRRNRNDARLQWRR